MGDVILKIEDVSKQYQLGQFGTGTIGRDVDRWWRTKVLKQEDPYLKIGAVNDRTSKEKSNFVWALKDINFEVKPGEVLGIIGKNGAGKSTLLKLLSRITSPTMGTIKSAGRMASLLEVGTGFHPELTGRENVFLNGAILGMTKNEIQTKFDEIVDFSGCELYIDTPTKRYSSGMTVRLGFAVAAFLDPEILVVDEVLAVGDAEFQKKAIGKMDDVSKTEGRTILFVSHNMNIISGLCNRALVLENGSIKYDGDVNAGIDFYLQNTSNIYGTVELDKNSSKLKPYGTLEFSKLIMLSTKNKDGVIKTDFYMGEPMIVEIQFELSQDIKNLEIGFALLGPRENNVSACVSTWDGLQRNFQKGVHSVSCIIDQLNLLPNTYSITLWIKREGYPVDIEFENLLKFNVIAFNQVGELNYYDRYAHLSVYKKSNWNYL